MVHAVLNAVGKAGSGIAVAIRAQWKVFAAVGLGVFALNLFLPVVVLSLARKPVDAFTFNPWLSRLPEWLASGNVPITRKLEFLSTLALAWFSAEADNPVAGREWGFIVDVPSLVRFIFTALLFGAYFALWFYRRDETLWMGAEGEPARGSSGCADECSGVHHRAVQCGGMRGPCPPGRGIGIHRALHCHAQVFGRAIAGGRRGGPASHDPGRGVLWLGCGGRSRRDPLAARRVKGPLDA